MSKIKITMRITNEDGNVTNQKLTIPSDFNTRYSRCGVMGNFTGNKEDHVSVLLTFVKTIDPEGSVPGIRQPR